MNILFLTLLDFNSVDERNIYTDLLREFSKYGHNLFIISPIERSMKTNTKLLKTDKATILKLKIGNTQKTNIIEKGISTISIEFQFIKGIKEYFSNTKFDLVIFSTPPITFCNAIKFVKNRDEAKTYLLLKDIFPQNAVDIGMMSKTGLKGLIYKYFRNKENELYKVLDAVTMEDDKIVAIGNAEIREIIQSKLSNLVTLIHPNAVVSRRVEIGEGTVIMAGAVINSDVIIVKGCIINTGASVDHDCKIGDFVHVSVGAHVAGTASIGSKTWIGAGATASNNVSICGHCMIGAGAVVINNLANPGTYVGIPV